MSVEADHRSYDHRQLKVLSSEMTIIVEEGQIYIIVNIK